MKVAREDPQANDQLFRDGNSVPSLDAPHQSQLSLAQPTCLRPGTRQTLRTVTSSLFPQLQEGDTALALKERGPQEAQKDARSQGSHASTGAWRADMVLLDFRQT